MNELNEMEHFRDVPPLYKVLKLQVYFAMQNIHKCLRCHLVVQNACNC